MSERSGRLGQLQAGKLATLARELATQPPAAMPYDSASAWRAGGEGNAIPLAHLLTRDGVTRQRAATSRADVRCSTARRARREGVTARRQGTHGRWDARAAS